METEMKWEKVAEDGRCPYPVMYTYAAARHSVGIIRKHSLIADAFALLPLSFF